MSKPIYEDTVERIEESLETGTVTVYFTSGVELEWPKEQFRAFYNYLKTHISDRTSIYCDADISQILE